MTTIYDNTPGVYVPEFCDDAGFPFDDTEDRGLRTRQRLDELAQRHPEFAEHLNPDRWGRSRTGSGSRLDDDPFARFNTRAAFQDFPDFPFDEFNDPRFERFYQSHEPAPNQPSDPQHTATAAQQTRAPEQKPAQQQHQQPPAPAQSQTAPPVTSKPPTAPDSGKKIQQSSTVDLGQPQAPLVDETRTHRSMSAPPEHPNRASGKRYVNRVNIPNVNADMGGSASQPQQPGPTQSHAEPPHSGAKERIIPIHVEGRDEVVTPSASAQAQHQPQGERIFGQRPNIFTQYVNPQEQTQDDMRHQEEMRRQQQQQKYQEYMRQQQQHQQQQQQHQQEAGPQPQPPKQKPTSLELIQNIQKDVSELMTQVENFSGKPRDKAYLYLDEMLTRKMLLLDDIETGGQDSIRKARKEAIRCIQDTIKVLENMAQANEEAANAPAREATQTPAPLESMDTTTLPASSEPEQVTEPTPVEPEQDVATCSPPKDSTKEKTPDNQELVVGGVARSGSQVTAMEAETAAASTTDAQPPPEPKIDDAKEGASEKKRVKKKADKK